jgi:hypothetical protein
MGAVAGIYRGASTSSNCRTRADSSERDEMPTFVLAW